MKSVLYQHVYILSHFKLSPEVGTFIIAIFWMRCAIYVFVYSLSMITQLVAESGF